jgi:DNA invertase Pin-like site-specific DNA recombinase
MESKERAAIYVRTSKITTAQIYQEEDCRKYCEERGYEVVEDLVVKEIASPSTLKRKGLTKIIVAAEEGKFDVLVTWEFSVLTSHHEDREYISAKFRNTGVRWERVWRKTEDKIHELINRTLSHFIKGSDESEEDKE